MPPRVSAPSAGADESFLLLAARASPASAQRQAMAALAGRGADWPRVARLAERNGVAALLYRHLRALPPGAAPPGVVDALGRACRTVASNNLLLTGQLHAILRRFDAAGIEALAWKGPALAAQAYGDLSLRGFNDLDLIVRPNDVARARAVLLGMGYARAYPLTPAQERAALRTNHEEQFTRDGQLVELHWRVAKDVYDVPLDVSGLFERRTWVNIGRQRVPTLDPSDLLLTLCVHGTSHAWHRLIWVCDVAEVVRNVPGVDWARVLGESARDGYGRMVRLGLALAWRLLDAPLPPEARAAVERDPAIPALIERVRPQFTGDDKGAGLVLPFQLGVRERRRDRAALLARAAFRPAPEDWSLLPLPDAAYPLYYVLRPLRLLGHYGVALALGRR